MTRRSAAAMAVLVLAALAVWQWNRTLGERESGYVVEVRCEGSSCFGTVDDGPPLHLELPPGPATSRSGLYVFHPYEYSRTPLFRDLRWRDASSAEDLQRLQDPSELSDWIADDGWRIVPGRGLTHDAPLREMSIALLERPGAADFTLSAEFEDAEDAGLVFRATDRENGWLFIVRPVYNDAFFCAIRDGVPDEIAAIMPLGEMRTARELLRLGGLIAELLLLGLALLVASRLAVRHLTHRIVLPASAATFLRREQPPGWLVPLLMMLTVLGAGWIAVVGLGAVPHVNDEAAYLFQAKIFAQGRAWAPVPSMPEFFQHEHMIRLGDRWFSKYPPLFSLLLVPGLWAGVPWLVNPLLAALTGWVLFTLARDLSNWRWGAVAWCLALVSPFFMMMAGSLMAHMASALLVSLALLGAIRAMRRKSAAYASLAGACLGLEILTRPYTALLAALALGLLVGIEFLRRSRPGERTALLRVALWIPLTVLPFVGAYLGWNLWLSSPQAPTTNLYAAYQPHDTLGFGPDKGQGWWITWGSWGHTPAKGLRSVYRFAESTSRHLLGWPGRLSLTLLLAAACWGRRRTVFWGGVGLCVLLVSGHALYWGVLHIGYGARYWFAAVPLLLVFTALGLRWLISVPENERAWPDTVRSGALVVAIGLLLMTAWNFGSYFPSRWKELPRYAGVSAELKREVARRDLDRGLVFVWTEDLIYNEGFFMNDPFLADDLLFANDLGERNVELMRRHPELPAYRWTRDKRLVPLGEPSAAPLAVAAPRSRTR